MTSCIAYIRHPIFGKTVEILPTTKEEAIMWIMLVSTSDSPLMRHYKKPVFGIKYLKP